jgi:hypothetical protein
MTTVTMFWHGGSSYATFDTHNPDDAEQFDSLAKAKRAFAARLSNSHYPCVEDSAPDEGGPEAWVFKGPKKDCIGADYPDFLMSFGPRGGVVVVPA